MSEVQSRPTAPRGRGSARGGRGGAYSSRGGRGGRGHATNGDKAESTPAVSIEDEGEVGQLKKKYGSKVSTIKEMFPDWTDEDVVFALQETNGDLETTVDHITNGEATLQCTISQWGEVSKTKKDRSRSKVKDATVTSFGDATNVPRGSRGGRAGFDTGRGRGRGTDRGRGGRGRGASVAHTNGSRKENEVISIPTTETSAWDTPASNDAAQAWDAPASTEKPAEDSWGATATGAVSSTATATTKAASSIIPDGVKKSWASIFAPAPAPKKVAEPIEKPAEPTKSEEPVELPTTAQEPPIAQPAPVELASPPPNEPTTVTEPETAITPSKDELTEDNLEQLPDTSAPAPSATAASTAASSWDTRTTTGTPYSALPQGQAQAVRPAASGFQASALKATSTSGRTPSYQRRVLDQEEAVRMPGNREVDRAAVQFGAFNLNGSGEEDVDGDREEPETRGQPPQHSPVPPRASLPPAPVSETLPTPKQPAGLPAASHPTAAPGLPSPPSVSSTLGTSQPGSQANAQFSQYSRYTQGAQESSSLPQKPYDAFSQQAPSTQSPFEGYPNQPGQSQALPPSGQSGAFSSAPNDFSSYYTSDPQQRNAYQNYYNHQYGSQGQGAQGQQDGPASQQRSFSGYNGPQSEGSSQFPQSATQQAPSRYTTAGEGQNSGHTTPNPSAQPQQPGVSQGGAQPQPGPQQPGTYPYGHPFFSSPYYAAYMNQYPGYGGGNYPAGPYGAKGGLQQPYQGYGMSPAAPYDQHASSPAGGFGGASSLHGRDGALGGLGDYGRAGSAQSAQTPQSLGGSGAFGGHDAFGRGSSYQGQNQGHYNPNQSSQQGGDDLKPFGDSKTANGPSPSLSQANRPGSATNTAPGSVLPPPQSQGGYGGYPAHLQQQGGHGLHGSQAGSQYGGLGGAGGHQAGGQNSQYGGYQGFGGNYYGGNTGQQQRGGWGGNYGH
ncbi:CUE domain-containing protein [Lachnellula arida]|uniref:RNA polymerase II degradation factor 1 n=1 Tax=Lachnellula arida TaxID=1316785 RepID=A0A8T9BGE1_9HELO|nr:CUE domain-containing protein [Lachnellula arida]